MRMDERCPGQESRNLQVVLCPCPKCGTEVEVFSDEARARCQKCGEIVYREKSQSGAGR
jgi:hypothetical protein